MTAPPPDEIVTEKLRAIARLREALEAYRSAYADAKVIEGNSAFCKADVLAITALAHSDTQENRSPEEKKPDGTYWCQVHNRAVVMAVPWMPSVPDPVCRCPKEEKK